MAQLYAITPVEPIRESVYKQLRALILNNGFPEGQRLVEQEIAVQLGVSRTPVRDALRRLESEGILEALPRGGLIVKVFTEEELVELYRIREALECLAAEYAAVNATDADLRDLEDLVLRMETPDMDDAQWADVHLTFSTRYNAASHMPNLLALLGPLREKVVMARNATVTNYKRKSTAMREHRELFEALRAKNPARARALTSVHIRNALAAYRQLRQEKEFARDTCPRVHNSVSGKPHQPASGKGARHEN